VDSLRPVERRNLNLITQNELGIGKGKNIVKICAFTLQKTMGLDLHGYIEISRTSSAFPYLSFTGNP
jgi:hypothetical protein